MVLIIGGGLAGMSTAYHLGDVPHLVLEAGESPGGLCRSREIDGYVFDYTGHLLHLRDEKIQRLVDELLPDAFDVVERKAAIRTQGVNLPFPFQANLHGLPAQTVADCLVDFIECSRHAVPDDPADEAWSDGDTALAMRLYSDRLAADPEDGTAPLPRGRPRWGDRDPNEVGRPPGRPNFPRFRR